MRRWRWLGLLVFCAFVSLGLLIYPLTVIQPFKYQDPHDLQRALLVFRVAPTVALLVAAVALLAALFAWKSFRTRQKFAASLLVALSCGAALLVRVNVFEKMFHPAGAPRFVAVQESKLDPSDMLIAVALKGDAHGYPIREMGYHHVVNDFVGGEPIVATY